MVCTAEPTDLAAIAPMRERHREELACQIIRDAIHARPGWSREHVLRVDGVEAGYGSVAAGGPWRAAPAVYECYVLPEHRARAFDLFAALLDASGARKIDVQSNDPLAAVMLHAFATDVVVEKLLFADGGPTDLRPAGGSFRQPGPEDWPGLDAAQRRWHGIVTLDGTPAGRGGILFHYNPPYGDVYMEIDEPFRQRGLGAFLVQELMRICREGGYVPAARCRPDNEASRRTLSRAGFVPCGALLSGDVRR